MATIQAWQSGAPGAFAKNLTLNESLPRPDESSLKEGQLLIQVSHAALNPADYKLPELGLVSRAVVSYPKIPSMDAAGTVLAVGPSPTDPSVKVGDRVVARIDPMGKTGALSQVTVLAKGSWAVLPSNVSSEQAAGVPTVGLTAYESIKPYVKEGDKVFINGSTGGTGTAGIQIAKILGCHVTVTCSEPKAQLCKDLGADEIIDYKSEDVIKRLSSGSSSGGSPEYTLIVDNIGNSPSNLYARCHEILKPGGQYIFVGGNVSAGSAYHLTTSILRPSFLGGQSRSFKAIMTKNDEQALKELVGWMSEGRMRTVVDQKFGWGEVKEAFEKLRGGRCTGKVIIEVSNEEKKM